MALQPLNDAFSTPGAGLSAHDDDRVAAVAAKAYARIVAAWKLNNRRAADLIAVSPRTWARMKSVEWSGRLNRDQLLRVSAITGLYKALHLYFSDALADRWINLRNSGPAFAGREPVEAMIEGGLPAIIETRNYVDALRGGA
ncbi:antitoxin Xre-like helix-turn-helix domain-containing protein [Hoeflea sp.]|uniref:antitoxin Xre-like helix-turn-helix domain-containing protein n=1 Tax=Hoeflea sp. TaxID=1940281 RepID=UPI003B025FDB